MDKKIVELESGQTKTVIEYVDQPCMQLERTVTINAGAKFRSVLFLESCPEQLTYDLIAAGAGASAELIIIYFADQSQKIRIKTSQFHHAAHTASIVTVKGIAADYAQVDFQGTISIAPHAQHTEAELSHKALLHDNTARIISKPELEVLTHEVKCAHGSAISNLDDLQLWYAQSRAISYEDARKMLMIGFYQDVLHSVSTEYTQRFFKRLQRRMDR